MMGNSKNMLKKWGNLFLVLVIVLSLCFPAMAEEDPIGEVDGNIYTNSVFGFQMVLPDNWHFLNDLELAQRMDYSVDYASREGLARLLKETTAACCMMATTEDDPNSTVHLMVQDLGLYRYLDEQTFFNAIKEGLSNALTSLGFADVKTSQQTFRLADKEYVVLDAEGTKNNITEHSLFMYFISDNVTGVLTIKSSSKENAMAILDFLQPL